LQLAVYERYETAESASTIVPNHGFSLTLREISFSHPDLLAELIAGSLTSGIQARAWGVDKGDTLRSTQVQVGKLASAASVKGRITNSMN
jgi:hypothetical protein